METVLTLLTGVLMGAFNFGFFCLGYYLGTRKKPEDGMELTEKNAEFVKEMMNWRMYGGEQ